MIKINLLKSPAKGKEEIRITGKPHNFLAWSTFLALLIIITISAVVVFIYIRMRPEPQKKVVYTREGVQPSTFVRTNIIEETVTDTDDTKLPQEPSGLLRRPYQELSFAEKVNYEIAFARNVCLLLSKIPSGIELTSVRASNFLSIEFSGLSPSKELIASMVTTIRKENLQVAPKPDSYIKLNQGGNPLFPFKFTFIVETHFGLNLSDPMFDGSLSFVPSRNQLGIIQKKIFNIAKNNGVYLKNKFIQKQTESIGKYRRLSFELTGESSFEKFVGFINSLYNEKTPVAFNSFNLKAISSAKILFTAELLITTND